MKFMLGANYWGADYGSEMWRHYDGDRIRAEMKQLSEYGVRYLRVFPNWRDFQPVEKAYAVRGEFGEYLNANTGEPVYGDGVDMDRIGDFRDFCRAAEENGIKLAVSVVTGWMSGRLFVPPVVSGKNPITDPEALMWTRRFIRRFVGELKNEPAIVMWDLGNECNSLGKIETPFDAYAWTAFVRDSIFAVDHTRPISSGMHSLREGAWQIEDQGEITDMLTTHPYPSPTVGGNMEPYNRLRMTYLPTAQSLYYSGVSKRPAYIQESGTFSQTVGSREMSAQFMRIQILSALVHNLCGYMWWCAWEQEHLNFPPYSWSMMERQLGLFDGNRQPKPVAIVMRKMSKLIEDLPDPFPRRKTDGVCVLTRVPDKQKTAIASLILAKQAGLDLEVASSECGDIPQSDLYFVPSVAGWKISYKKTWDTLMDRVRKGATLCISYERGDISDFPETVGAVSRGIMAGTKHTARLGETEFSYGGTETFLTPTTAQVLAANEEGNPVLLKNRVGEGFVYFVNFAPETLAFNEPDGFNRQPYYEIYRTVGKDLIASKPVSLEDKNPGATINPEGENTCIVSVLNYSDKDIKPEVKIRHGWRLKEILYGSLDAIPACDGVIFRIEK